jgi:hypothetical protein
MEVEGEQGNFCFHAKVTKHVASLLTYGSFFCAGYVNQLQEPFLSQSF